MKLNTAVLKTIPQKEELLKRFTHLKAEAADIEGELSLLREKIIEQIAPGQYNDYLVLIEDQERESFQWKQAQATLPDPILQRLREFVKISKYQTVKVNYIGGKSK